MLKTAYPMTNYYILWTRHTPVSWKLMRYVILLAVTKTNYRWKCQLQEALHMWGKDRLLLLQEEGSGVRICALRPRGRDLFLVREIHDVGLTHYVLAGHPKIHIILQRQRNEQSEHLRSERHIFIVHSRQPRPV
jgi:hypothetical protein